MKTRYVSFPLASASRRRLLLGSAGLAAASILGPGALRSTQAAARRQESDSGTFTALLARGLPDLDPHSAYDGVASSVIVGVYETLLKLEGTSTTEYAPGLATSWEESEGGAIWTFTLAEGAAFHDGTPCDADAVVSSFRRFLSMGTGPVDVLARFVAAPEDISVADVGKVQFRLKAADPLFLAAMASQYGPYVVSPAAVEANGTEDDPFAHEWLLANMVGTGPYRVVELAPNEQVILERFEDYHAGWEGPHFSRIVFRVVPDLNTRRQLMESGDADALVNSLTPESLAPLRENRDLQVIEYPSTNVDWGTFNCGGALASPEARQGLSWAFPYEEVRTAVMGDLYEATGGPLAPMVRGYDPGVFVYSTDLAKAKELLDASVGSGASFSWSASSDNQLSASTAQLMKANLNEIGYDLDIELIDRGAQIDMAYGVTDPAEKPDVIGDWAWFPDYNDVYNQIAPNFHSEGGSNIGFYANPRIDEILAALSAGPTDDEYAALAAEAQNILTEQDPPAIFMGAKRFYTVLAADIRGFEANPIYLEGYNLYGMYRDA
jgi:peptide/nickel transport system substrate-binding protein